MEVSETSRFGEDLDMTAAGGLEVVREIKIGVVKLTQFKYFFRRMEDRSSEESGDLRESE